ncbi:c-type cytochrome [Pseudoduganella sp. RAF53_2]|uniref:c-type cytochrome n=1 Tax=unclassified Pseudoduganella TaxID=2637179 RepID=UPI003F9E7159
MKRTIRIIIAVLLLLVVGAVGFIWPKHDAGPPPSEASKSMPLADKVARGAYLAKAGDCMACHTPRGGAAYAGGRTLQTPFGGVVSPNITSDKETGIGSWTADDFWNALHNGTARDGRLLYPAFPYTNYTVVSRDDSDALYAYFQTVPAVKKKSEPHTLRFPYNQQVMLAVWRALYFKPAVFEANKAKPADWNRGAYLVNGLGHCVACHSSRNVLGASDNSLSGGLIPVLGWYAPSLTSDAEAGLGNWQVEHISDLLKTGVSPRATVFGPMAEVVRESLQHLSDDDVHAMAVYLKSLPAENDGKPQYERSKEAEAIAYLAAGEKIYRNMCMDCHGEKGEGNAPHYPPLSGNRALTMDVAVNPIRIVLNGGFAPGTAGNPRPYGMPPFSHALSDMEVAQVVSYLRSAWGNNAPPVNSTDVNRYRNVPLD